MATRKDNFPVYEAINAAGKFDVSGKDAGVVELLEDHNALVEFCAKKGEGKYYKPHQIYYAVYRPKSDYMVPVAASHHLQSKGTITSCAKTHPDVFDIEPDFNTFIRSVNRVPTGTPFFMVYLKDSEVERFGITGTVSLNDEKYYKNTQRRMRTYIATKIIPRMGRSILRDTTSRFGLKTKGTTTDPVECEECGGVFRKDTRGDYVCQGCGLIYERDDKFVAEDLAMTNDFEDEVLEFVPTQKDLLSGGLLPGALMMLEVRLARNIQVWRQSIARVPSDEIATKEHLHEVKLADIAARKAHKDNNIRGHDIYEGKWNKLTTNARVARVLYFLRCQGKTTISDLTHEMQVHRMYVVRAIEELVQKGRVIIHDNGLNKKAKVTTIVYIPTGKEYRGRCAKECRPPVPLQVRYGNVQQKTINYRNSSIVMKCGVAFDGKTATTLYSIKE